MCTAVRQLKPGRLWRWSPLKVWTLFTPQRVWASHFAGWAVAGVPDQHQLQLQLDGLVVPQQMWWPCSCLSYACSAS